MAEHIQIRRDVAANWTAYNPILADGELGLEKDTGLHKLGDGVSSWTELGYSGVVAAKDGTKYVFGQITFGDNLLITDNGNGKITISADTGGAVTESLVAALAVSL